MTSGIPFFFEIECGDHRYKKHETKTQSEALRLILDYLVLVVFASIPSHISRGCFSSFADGVSPGALSENPHAMGNKVGYPWIPCEDLWPRRHGT